MDASIRTNAAQARTSVKVVGRFWCQEALEGHPPFVVHKARAQGLAGFDRIFAIKTLAPAADLARPDAAQRLLNAASAATAIRDVRVGQVVDSGTTADGMAYVATEFVAAPTLAGLPRAFAMINDADAARGSRMLALLAADLCGALASAHAAQPAVAHGGVAPSNVFVTARGAVKVVDFGHRVAVLPARLPGGKRPLSPYAAPELLLSGDATSAADVFAAGAVLFELVTGQPPPSARNPRSPADLARAVAALVPDVGEALLTLLRVDPGKRPAAAAAESLFRGFIDGHAADLCAAWAALVRAAGQTTPQPTESAVLPALVGSSPPVAAVSSTAPTRRHRRPSAASFPPPLPSALPRSQEAGPSRRPVEPQKTLPSGQMFHGLLAGAVPEAPHHAAQTAEVPASPADVAASAGALAAMRAGPSHESEDGSSAFELSLADLEAVTAAASDMEPTAAGVHYDVLQTKLAVETAHPSGAAVPVAHVPPLAVAGAARPPSRPNMDNLTTGEMEAMFAGGMGEPGAARARVASDATARAAGDTTARAAGDATARPDDDFLEDAKTNAFARRRVAALLGEAHAPLRSPPAAQVFPDLPDPDVQTPAATLPWLENAAPANFHLGAKEGTNEVEDAQLMEPSHGGELRAWPVAESDDISDDEGYAREAAMQRRRMLAKVAAFATAAVVAVAGTALGSRLLNGRASSKRTVEVQAAAHNPATTAADATPPTKRAVAQTPPAPDDTPPDDRPVAPAPDEARVVQDGQRRVRLQVESQPPGAAIWINGGARGHTPAQVELKPRHRTLVLILPGHRRSEQSLDPERLSATHTVQLVPASPPQPGAATVNVTCQTPGQYPISIDGQETGLLCPADVALAPGAHTVAVFVPWRFKSYESRVSVGSGKTKTVSFPK